MALAETNINTTNVGNAIGSASHNVGALCIHTSVNKWSRKKPVLRHNSTPTDWYKEYNGKFSLVIPTVQLPSLVYNSSNAWTYTKPNDTYGYRLGDFRGYDHAAIVPFYTSAYPSGSFPSLATSPQWVHTKNNNTALGITAADLSIDSYYYGIMIEWIATGYANRWAITDSYNIGNANKSSLVVDLTGEPFSSTTFDGTFRWTSFVSASAMTSWTDLTTAPNYTVIPTPGTATGTFTAYKQNFDITPTSWEFAAAGETKQFGVDTYSTNGWTASLIFMEPVWCAFSGSASGTGDGGVSIIAEEADTHIRAATLRFSCDDALLADVDVDLTQPAAE